MNTVETGRYLDLKNDFAFKHIFANKVLLISFLNALLRERKTIVDITYLNVEQLGRRKGDRKAFFDLYCTDETGEQFVIEMQVGRQRHFMDRILSCAARAILKQAKTGKWDFELQPLFVISIVNFDLHPGNDRCISYHSLMDEDTFTKTSNKLQLVSVELKKFNKLVNELVTDRDKWLYCLRHLAQLSAQPVAIQGEVFDELFELAEFENLKEEDMRTYKKNLLQYNDVRNEVECAREDGVEEGMQKGIQRGVQQGIQHGILQGVQQTTYEIAQKCIQEGMSLDFVIRITGLSSEELKSIGLK
ncbi:hypothetical protein AGMMS49982_08340 [Bacteroidia bacterium]|nr:hypothetical protein AGMMS49982_08340 [Bacteroidia bacterium]